MPSGIVHARASLALAASAFGLGWGATGDYRNGLAGAFGCCLGILLTPDLDQESISTSEYALIKWTMGLGFLWTLLWYPYARACKHRSFLSHFPVVSTLGRLAYLGLFVALGLYCGLTIPMPPANYAAWSLVGLLMSDCAHWFMDVKWGDHKARHRGKAH